MTKMTQNDQKIKKSKKVNNLAFETNSTGHHTKTADFEAKMKTGPSSAENNTLSAAELQVIDSDMANINATFAEYGIDITDMDYRGCGQNENTCFFRIDYG